MTNRDIAPRLIADLATGFGLLSRLPLPHRPPTGPQAAWSWPIVGLCLGGIAALMGSLALWFGLTPGVAAALSLATAAVVTGALHEDGLADTADGLFGGWTRERRLDIMKDSRIGTFGALALIFSCLARWSALTALFTYGAQWEALLAAGALSRAPMAVLMTALPNARGTGLSASVGAPPVWAATCATGLAAAMGFLLLGWTVLTAILLIGLLSLALASLAQAKIGGQTGDILGASQQLSDLAVLAVCAAVLA